MLFYRLDYLSLKLEPYEHKILRELKRHGVLGRTLLLAVSGGLDSLFLLLTLARLKKAAKFELCVAHIHHGSGPRKQKKYRDLTQIFVQKFCESMAVPFHTNKNGPKKSLRSEESMRDFRYCELKKIKNSIEYSINVNAKQVTNVNAEQVVLVTAHHQDDLFETQLMRIVRGTGPEGLSAMSFYDDEKLRPLIFMSRDEVLKYAKKYKLKWKNDPSNKKTEPLRNWMRQVWIPSLEKKIPGAKKSFFRSLALLSQLSLKPSKGESLLVSGIDRRHFLSLDREHKSMLIVQYIRQLGISSYTHGQVNEILKRLDNSRGEYTFTLLKHQWQINAEQIVAHKS